MNAVTHWSARNEFGAFKSLSKSSREFGSVCCTMSRGKNKFYLRKKRQIYCLWKIFETIVETKWYWISFQYIFWVYWEFICSLKNIFSKWIYFHVILKTSYDIMELKKWVHIKFSNIVVYKNSLNVISVSFKQ